MHRFSTKVLLTFAAASALMAQGPIAPTQGAGTQGTTGRTNLDVHTERSSRELFAACDGDSDDRLDLFEASAALDTLGDPTDSGAFRALDSDRDGYLGWSEFDAHFRSVIERGNTFRVRTCRRFTQSPPELREAKAATPLELFLQLHDGNQNGGLDPDEISKIARDIGLLPVFEAELKMLDTDQSGRIEQLELEPWFDKIRSVVKLPGIEHVSDPSVLPQPWGAIDANGDSAIDLAELRAALRRLDAALVRWAEHLMQQHDRNSDGKLQADELPRPPTAEPATPGTRPAGSSTAMLPASGAPGLVGMTR